MVTQSNPPSSPTAGRRTYVAERKSLPFRVLVCDDEQLVRWSLAEHLKKEGYQVETADDGQQALERIWPPTPEMMRPPIESAHT